MQDTEAFAPVYKRTVINAGSSNTAGTLQTSVTVTATNASATASGVIAGDNPNGNCQIQIANTTTAWAYVNFGILGAVTAATVAASYPVAPGAVVAVSVDPEVNAASVILGSAPGTNTAVIFTRGAGV